ncbi:MAG TPA: sodium:solute symporter family protein [Ignavibacteriaceae bacterium]|nr:sodium:solute symporter family protein [Ignavibacteriaceae bacterium]
MISFNSLDIIIIILFFVIVLLIGFISGRYTKNEADDYLLSGRKVGLLLFILTNVSAWYGGILGVGEFTYRYGIASWFTQGFPYYIFAFLFALFFARKIHSASLFTIPDKITDTYGKTAGLISAVLVFVLVSPAPYVLMTGNLISLTFKTGTLLSLFISVILSMIYLFQGGFRSNVFTDSFQFFVMFAGFILMLIFCGINLGGYDYLAASLPASHLKLTGSASPLFIIVWFLIALWTFADPGFHQRCYAAKTGGVAVKGILISIFFWALFDFLTTSTGLFARAGLPGIEQPVLSFPLLAEKILPSGIKGIFYAGLFATIISTSNSFLFLSGTTVGRDFLFRIKADVDENKLKLYTVFGLIISGLLSILLAYLIPSVIEIWYTLGSLCIPAIIPAVISSYYPKFRIGNKIMIAEMITAVTLSTVWYFLRESGIITGFVVEIEPMIVGLLTGAIIHFYGILKWKNSKQL